MNSVERFSEAVTYSVEYEGESFSVTYTTDLNSNSTDIDVVNCSGESVSVELFNKIIDFISETEYK